MKLSTAFPKSILAQAATLLLVLVFAEAPAWAAESKTQKALFQLEEDLCAGYLRDISLVERILADDYIIVVDDKPARTKADEVNDLKSGKLKVTLLTA